VRPVQRGPDSLPGKDHEVTPVVWLESFRIAFREMRRHRTRSALTMLGVIIGVAAIIAVMAISQGAKRSIQGQISNAGSNMILVLPGSTSQGGVQGGAGSARTLTVEDAEAIQRECSAVASAAPLIRVVCQTISELGNWSTVITGTTAEYFIVRAWGADSGRVLEPRDVVSAAKVGLIGRTTARQLFGEEDPIGQRVRVNGTPVQIIGVLSEKGQNPLGTDEDDTIVIPITTCFQHLTGETTCHALVISAISERDMPLAINQVEAVLRHRHRIRDTQLDDFTVKNMAEWQKTAETVSDRMTMLLVSIAAISLLVGGIGIMNIMLVTVMERTREIGVRMALGASRRMIVHQFTIEAGALAGVGGFVGVCLGVAGSHLASHLTRLPAIITPPLLVLPMVFAVAIGIIFGLLPARRASHLNPVESLRHE
jgi:putative ABC transport system permease protein